MAAVTFSSLAVKRAFVILVVCLFTLPALAWRHGAPTPASGLVNVPGLALGAVTANSLAPSYFSNEADTVSQNNFWTTSNVKYLAPPDGTHFGLKTLGSYRDVEVKGWSKNGLVLVRLDNTGRGIYFKHQGNSINGELEIGIATGVDETNYNGASYYPLYLNDNLVGTVPGYTKTATEGQYFTFGVAGFDIYVKYNGVEFLRFKEYRQMNAGTVGFKAVDTYSWRGDSNGNVTVTPLPSQHVYSRYSLKELDMRDFGMRAIQTTGSISASSASLVIAAKQNFQVGDWVIVEIGAEAGAGARGTNGVGGTWPALSYATGAAMDADTAQPQFTYAWRQDTGNVYNFGGGYPSYGAGTNYNTGDRVGFANVNYESIIDHNISNQPDVSPTAWRSFSAALAWIPLDQQLSYYVAKAIPLSLHGRITAISGDGLTLTLDNTAIAGTTNANVYLDNQPYVNYLTANQKDPVGNFGDLTPVTPANMTIIFPAGSYAGSGRLHIQAQNGWIIKGQGQTQTTLFSPNGVHPLNFEVGYPGFGGYTLSDFTLNGNHGFDKYGLDFPGWTYVPGGLTTSGLMPANHEDFSTITQTDIPQGSAYPAGIFINESDNVTVRDVTVNDVFQKAVGVSYSTNVNAYRVTNNQHAPLEFYIQWQFQWANSNGGSCVDCVLNSSYLIAGFESFASNGHQFIRPVSTNGTFSQNTSQNWLIQDAQLTVTAGSQYSETSFSKYQPLVNINSNIGGSDVSGGGTINNSAMVAQGYINANNDVPIGIIVNDSSPNISISGGSYTAPPYASPTALQGPVGILSTGQNTVVSGFKACGATGPLYDNITLFGTGSVSGSTADTLVAPTQSGNTIPCP